MPKFNYEFPEDELLAGATIAIRDCMGYNPGETVLIITDKENEAVGHLFYRAALNDGSYDHANNNREYTSFSKCFID